MAKAFVDNTLAILNETDNLYGNANIIIDAYQNGREQGLALNFSTTRVLNDFPLAAQPVLNQALLTARSYFAEPMEHNGQFSPTRQRLPSTFTLYIAKGRHTDHVVVWAGHGSNQGLPPDATMTTITEPKHLAAIIYYTALFS